MSLGTIYVIIDRPLLLGVLPTWPYSAGWGYYPSSGLGLVSVICSSSSCWAACRLAMAKRRKYSRAAGKDVEREERRYKRGIAHSGLAEKAAKKKAANKQSPSACQRRGKKARKCRRKNCKVADMERDDSKAASFWSMLIPKLS